MTELEKRLDAKIPGKDTGIEIRKSVCPICDRGCGIDAYVWDGKIIKIEGSEDHPVNKGYLCPRGISARAHIYKEDRVLYPMKRVGKRGEGKFERISWDEAYRTIAEKLNSIKEQYGAQAVTFYSGHTKWYRTFVQRLAYSFGTPNYATESSCCFTHGYMAGKSTLGYNVGPDMKNAGVFLGWTYCPHRDPRDLKGVLNFKKNGGKLIVVDCRRTQTAEIADLFLQPIPGTDLAIILCMANILIQKGWIDREYIDRYVYGFDKFKEVAAKYTKDNVEAISGVSYELIEKACEMIHENLPLSINKFNGHHINGYNANRALYALAAITGCYDRKGGLSPKPFAFQHMGGGYKTLDREFCEAKRPLSPLPVGCEDFPLWNYYEHEAQSISIPDSVLLEKPYRTRAIFGFGLNYRMWPNSQRMKEALKNLDFFVDSDLFMTDSAKLADIVLPAASTVERSDLKFYPGGLVWYPEPIIEPLGESRSDEQIVCDLANIMDLDDPILRSGVEATYDHILRNLPFKIADAKAPAPIKNSAFKPWVPGEAIEAGLPTPTKKIELSCSVIEEHPEWGLSSVPDYMEAFDPKEAAEYPLVLVAGARHQNRFHSRLVNNPWASTAAGELAAQINPQDAEELGIRNGDTVEISTRCGSITLKASVTEVSRRGTVNVYHDDPKAPANDIIPSDRRDPYTGFPTFKSARCRVRKAGQK
ncbi:MAG: molybdopterin-dependent oxidoreductase [Firmicutes bacterium]|nr:molybdopterin-dependent oxidoreductase [Bacillota bacterium]